MLSNLINISHASKVHDFYYGDIEKNLNKSGVKTFTVLRNFTDKTSKFINKIIYPNKILLTQRVSLFKEFLIVVKLINQYFFINNNFKKPKINNLNNNFLSLLSFRSMVANLRLCFQIQDLLKIIKPKLFIIPFEGHAWERLIIKMVHDLDPKIIIGSYQFTITTKYQHSLFRPLKKGYNPDIIFTSSKITQKKFKKKYDCPIKILGSNKYQNLIKKRISKKNNFLIIPEAFYSETYHLLNFTIKIAKFLNENHFIFRCHPMIDANEIKKNLNLPNNVELSTRGLKEDINICKYVLFRGSAAVFETVSHGLKPIYLDIENEPNINPFKDIFSNKYNVVKPEDFLKVLKKYKSNKTEKKIIKYANEYFAKIDINQIKSLL